MSKTMKVTVYTPHDKFVTMAGHGRARLWTVDLDGTPVEEKDEVQDIRRAVRDEPQA